LNVFLISTCICLIISARFLPHIRETGQARRRITARQFIFRVNQFNALMGLVYDLVSVAPRVRKTDGDTETGHQK